jgi:spore germination protein KC
MKKIIFSLFVLFCLTGCWNYKELNEYSIVTGIAIDKDDEGYKVSTLISNVPKGNSGSDSSSSNSEIVVYEGKGKSISQALKDIGLISPKELYLNSFYVLVISEDVARDGIDGALDFFLKYSSSRNNFNVIITKDCSAKDTLKIMTSITNYPSQSIADNLKTTTKLQGAIKTVNFDDLISTLIREGVEPTISTITIFGDLNEGFTKENLESSEPKAYIKLDNLAIFKRDKLIDFATHEESIGINILNNQVNEMYFYIDYNDGFAIFDTIKFKSKIETKVVDDKPVVNINLNGEARIIETSDNINLKDNKILEELKKKANEKIIDFVNQAIDVSIRNKSDILGIGRNFYQNHYNYYNKVKNNFDEMLDDIKYNINSNLILNNKVSAKNSLEEIHDR